MTDNSKILFGKELKQANISKVVLGKSNQYYGLSIKYISEEEYNKRKDKEEPKLELIYKIELKEKNIDNNSKVKSSESRITKYIWANTITNLDVNKKEWYDIPKGVTSSVIDPISGDVSAKGFVCYYEKGTEPNYVYNNIFDPN